MTPYGNIWVNIASGNGLLLDGTKPLPEKFDLIINEGQWPLMAILEETSQLSIPEISLKITCLKFHSNLPGANRIGQSGNEAFKIVD